MKFRWLIFIIIQMPELVWTKILNCTFVELDSEHKIFIKFMSGKNSIPILDSIFASSTHYRAGCDIGYDGNIIVNYLIGRAQSTD